MTGGVQRALDAVKALFCGARAVQVVSALLVHGARHLRTLVDELNVWMENHEIEALEPLIGCLSHERSADPRMPERANDARILQNWWRD